MWNDEDYYKHVMFVSLHAYGRPNEGDALFYPSSGYGGPLQDGDEQEYYEGPMETDKKYGQDYWKDDNEM